MASKKEMTGLMKRLKRLWMRGRLYAFIRNICVILLVFTAFVLVFFLLDLWLNLGVAARLSLLVFGLLIIGSTGYLTWWRNRLPYDPLVCALDVERKHPALGGLLVSYVQFSGGSGKNGDASPSLVAAMLKQAEEKSRAIAFHRMVRYGALWKLYLAVVFCGVILLAVPMKYPDFVRVFAARVLHPFAQNRYPTKTVLDRASEGMLIQHGQHAVLRAEVSGKVPKEIVFLLRNPDGSEDSLVVPAGESDGQGHWVFEHELKDVQRDFQYRILAGDAASPTYQVRVVHRQEQDIDAQVIYPAYLERKPAPAPILGFDAPLGSSIQWEISVDRPVSSGRIVFDHGESVPVKLSSSKLSGTVILKPDDSFRYGFEWTDDESGFVFKPAVWYQVHMVPDQPPTVTLDAGPAEEKATVWKVVNMTLGAMDDHGLASARLVYTRSRAERGDEELEKRVKQLLDFPQSTKKTTENLKWRLKDSIPDLAPGDVVTYSVEVLDRRPVPKDPDVGRSVPRTITIVSQEEYVKIAMERRRQLLARMQNLLETEIEADRIVEGLLEEAAE